MRGEILEAYCELSKADTLLGYVSCESNEKKVDAIREGIRDLQKKIYELGDRI